MFLKAATIALIPALIIQGKKVKKNTPRLPEPEGLRDGTKGHGKKLSILILGDSAAAGVGVEVQEDALLGGVLSELQNDYEITWKLHAKSGDGTSQIIRATEELPNQQYDIVLTSVGVNDVTKLMSADVWIKKQEKLYKLIQNKFQPSLIIAAGVPPMNLFPALPNPLGWLFGQYSKKMNEELSKFVEKTSNLEWIEYDIVKYQHLNLPMAYDGFHPSKEIYQIWAKEVADKVRKSF